MPCRPSALPVMAVDAETRLDAIDADQAVSYGFDVGAAVNLAARVSGEASGGEVLLTASTAARAPELDGVLYEPRGRRALRKRARACGAVRGGPRGRVERRGASARPRRRMAVDPKRSAGRLTYEDAAYFFCSLACAAEFARQPERIAREHS